MKDVELIKNNDKIIISRGKNTSGATLKIAQKIKLFKNKVSADGLNIIYLKENLYEKTKNDSLILLNEKSGKFIDVKIEKYKGEDMPDDFFICSKRTEKNIGISKGDECILCINNTFLFDKVNAQSLEEIKDDTIIISKKDANGLIKEGIDKDFRFYQFYNTVTNQSVIVKGSHIKIEDNINQGVIKMNMKQRLLLGVELPEFLTLKQVEILKNASLTDDERKLVDELYPGDNYFLSKDYTYNQQCQMIKILKTYTEFKIAMCPVVESYKNRSRRSFLKTIADFFVGKSAISLACRRPYITDEMANVVRITKSNMNLLGIKEMDDVILTYKNNHIRCRVLELSEKNNNFDVVNTPIDHELVVGVPAQVRDKLGVKDVNSVVKVERDTISLFKKNINIQVVPVILTLFSTKIFTLNLSGWISFILSIIAIPVVVYFNLSSKRNERIK